MACKIYTVYNSMYKTCFGLKESTLYIHNTHTRTLNSSHAILASYIVPKRSIWIHLIQKYNDKHFRKLIGIVLLLC